MRLAPLLEQVLENYPDEVRFVFKYYPRREHEFAAKAAIAAVAAQRQGKFWEFHDLLLNSYNRLNDREIRDLMEHVGLDMQRVEEDLRDPDLLATIDRDVMNGIYAGVTSTPTVFLNGRILRNLTLEGFRAAIEKELARVRNLDDFSGERPKSKKKATTN